MRSKIIFYSFLIMSAFTIASCKKNDAELKQEIAQLSSRVSNIENQLSLINTSLATLKEQGKLNTEEVSALKALTTSLSNLTNDIKNNGAANSTEIAALKASLVLTSTVVQYDDLKTTLAQLTDLVNKSYSEQRITAQTTTALQDGITQLAADLDKLKTTESNIELFGKIEKGAFAKGSLLYLYEMDGNLSQTGRSFNTSITDNYGSFDFRVNNLKGKITRVVADGFYYNEVSGKNSPSRISLTGITRIDSSEVMNVNVLTDVERPRVEYLMTHGKTFDQAKTQAITEVLNVFGIENPGIKRSEKINLIGSANRNNILFAISTLLVGYRTDSQLTELLNDIGEDLKTDGIMNDNTIGNDIATHLYYMDTTAVINQIKTKYAAFYPDSILSKINLKYIKTFQQQTNYTKNYNLIEYPKIPISANYQLNILDPDVTSAHTNQFELTANLKATTLKLKIEISIDFGTNPTPVFYLNYGNNTNWSAKYSADRKTMTFETSTPGISTCGFSYQTPDYSAKFNIKYYENGSSTPTQTKILTASVN
ncbi:MAG: hypothetical protein JWR05_346 [Mucilaginibacter sp.]|nr:hypothetical protein [Mucilaginibacter sp.]